MNPCKPLILHQLQYHPTGPSLSTQKHTGRPLTTIAAIRGARILDSLPQTLLADHLSIRHLLPSCGSSIYYSPRMRYPPVRKSGPASYPYQSIHQVVDIVDQALSPVDAGGPNTKSLVSNKLGPRTIVGSAKLGKKPAIL